MNSGKVKIGLVIILVLFFSVIAILFMRAKTSSIDESIIKENIIESNELKFTKEDEKKFAGTWKVSKAVSKESNEEIEFESLLPEDDKEEHALILNENNTFEDLLNSSKKTNKNTGTFALRENEASKYQLYLEYNDGKILKLDITQNGESYSLSMDSSDFNAILYLNK